MQEQSLTIYDILTVAVFVVFLFAIFSIFKIWRSWEEAKERDGKVDGGFLPFVKWPLLFASAGFNIFFTYYVFLPAGVLIAAFAAFVMGGVNLAEAYLTRLVIATWRHGMRTIFRISLGIIVPVFLYSLMAASSSFTTMMNKNQDNAKASNLEIKASESRMIAANQIVEKAKTGQKQHETLQKLLYTNLKNSNGTTVSFQRIQSSCLRGGYYAKRYPDVCAKYATLKDGSNTALSIAEATIESEKTKAFEMEVLAKKIRDRPPEIAPTLLGFGLAIALVGFIVSVALESAIVGVSFFEELFIKPTPLPAVISFMDKKLDWKESNKAAYEPIKSPSPNALRKEEGEAMRKEDGEAMRKKGGDTLKVSECINCGREYEKKTTWQKYCKEDCRIEAHGVDIDAIKMAKAGGKKDA